MENYESVRLEFYLVDFQHHPFKEERKKRGLKVFEIRGY